MAAQARRPAVSVGVPVLAAHHPVRVPGAAAGGHQGAAQTLPGLAAGPRLPAHGRHRPGPGRLPDHQRPGTPQLTCTRPPLPRARAAAYRFRDDCQQLPASGQSTGAGTAPLRTLATRPVTAGSDQGLSAMRQPEAARRVTAVTTSLAASRACRGSAVLEDIDPVHWAGQQAVVAASPPTEVLAVVAGPGSGGSGSWGGSTVGYG